MEDDMRRADLLLFNQTPSDLRANPSKPVPSVTPFYRPGGHRMDLWRQAVG